MAPREPTINVAIVEDNAAQRERLSQFLNNSPGFMCVAACGSAEEALVSIPSLRPDIVLMDIQLPRISGIECVRVLRDRLPEARIMMLTIFEDHECLFESLAAGATGYLLKSCPQAKLLEAIRDLHVGGAPMSGSIARLVVESFHKPSTVEGAKLTPIEWTVLQLLAKGLLYKEVAAKLKLSLGTINTHVCHIYDKLQVNNRTEAVRKALKRVKEWGNLGNTP